MMIRIATTVANPTRSFDSLLAPRLLGLRRPNDWLIRSLTSCEVSGLEGLDENRFGIRSLGSRLGGLPDLSHVYIYIWGSTQFEGLGHRSSGRRQKSSSLAHHDGARSNEMDGFHFMVIIINGPINLSCTVHSNIPPPPVLFYRLFVSSSIDRLESFWE